MMIKVNISITNAQRLLSESLMNISLLRFQIQHSRHGSQAELWVCASEEKDWA